MDIGRSFHISHDNVKFIVKEYVRLTEDIHKYEFKSDYYTLNFTLEKEPDANWDELSKCVYGKKVLRFTQRTNGEKGLWIVLRFPQEKVIEKAQTGEVISRTAKVDALTYSFTITFRPSIINQIKTRCNSRTKQVIAKRQKEKAENKKPIQYNCYNPKPYQGGSFTPK